MSLDMVGLSPAGGENFQRWGGVGEEDEADGVEQEQEEQDPADFFRSALIIEEVCQSEAEEHGQKIQSDIQRQSGNAEAGEQEIVDACQKQGHG